MSETPKDNITAILEKHSQLLEEIVRQNKKIRRRLMWLSLGGYFQLLLVLVPLVVAIIFLPPLLNDIMKQYGSVFGGVSGSKNILSNIDPTQIQNLLKQFQK